MSVWAPNTSKLHGIRSTQSRKRVMNRVGACRGASYRKILHKLLTTIRASSNVRPEASAMSLISSLRSPFFHDAFTHSSCSSAPKSPCCASVGGVSSRSNVLRFPPPRQAPAGTVPGRCSRETAAGRCCTLPGSERRLIPGDEGELLPMLFVYVPSPFLD